MCGHRGRSPLHERGSAAQRGRFDGTVRDRRTSALLDAVGFFIHHARRHADNDRTSLAALSIIKDAVDGKSAISRRSARSCAPRPDRGSRTSSRRRHQVGRVDVDTPRRAGVGWRGPDERELRASRRRAVDEFIRVRAARRGDAAAALRRRRRAADAGERVEALVGVSGDGVGDALEDASTTSGVVLVARSARAPPRACSAGRAPPPRARGGRHAAGRPDSV